MIVFIVDSSEIQGDGPDCLGWFFLVETVQPFFHFSQTFRTKIHFIEDSGKIADQSGIAGTFNLVVFIALEIVVKLS
ncbi:MAG: hypothetical protein AVO33_04240 [delta proteobacterium ML8_F1]|nr:MAG: hypothetical protein AVO33_04240 [delta proteobacterium ML8_F1]